MKIRALSVCLSVAFAIILFVPSINATWTEGGVELSTEAIDQYNHQIISDGSGGTIVAWYDGRNGPGNYDVFVQKFDADGNILWDVEGVNISQLGSNQDHPVLVSDGAGGAIIAYWSDRASDYDILVQRVRSNGTVAWALGGLTLCGAPGNQYSAVIVSDYAGGAIVSWEDFRSGNFDIYAARIDTSGSMPWTLHGVPVCQASNGQYDPEITTDGSHGAIITWADDRDSDNDIYIQKIDQNGNYSWTYDGEVVENWTGIQSMYQIISDMLGGAIVTWASNLSGYYNIRAIRFHGDGTEAWSSPATVGEYSADQIGPKIMSDGNGGAIIAWIDLRNGNNDVYTDHIDYAGGSDWGWGGTPICTQSSYQTQIEIVTDSQGGAIILWSDHRNYNNYEIFGQKIASNGDVKWQENGLNLTPYPADQTGAKAIATDDGGFIAVWQDNRNLADSKLYAQIFDERGFWGDPAPVITDASDVPADQGGNVLIEWSPIRMDEYPEELITHYTIWRSVSAPAAVAMMQENAAGTFPGTAVTSPGEIGLEFEGTAYRTDIAFGAAAAWEWVASVDAHYWEEYAYTCGTLHDFIDGVEDGMHYFVISAHTAYPFIFWDSDPDSAISIDNLSPCPPLGLAGDQLYYPPGLELTWEPNSETDLGGYNIYRDSDPVFVPGPGNLLATTCDTLVFDGEWTGESGYCYKVAAMDIHGNESDYALLCFEEVTGDDPMPVPDATFLAQNFPNPFNPATTIAFGLKSGGFVNLSVYDAAGRLVATLINESRSAGQYAAVWNGNDKNGSHAASGVYFYRLITKEFEETKKMILLR